MARPVVRALAAAALALWAGAAGGQSLQKPEGAIRVATFNAHLAKRSAGDAIALLLEGGPQVDAVVEIIQRVRPDILLVNEIDYDPAGEAAELLRADLETGRGGAEGVAYPHLFVAPVNTGVASGVDLDRDGAVRGPGDALGWGLFPGQFGMALFSRFPIETASVRTFRRLLWAETDLVEMPRDEKGASWYAPDALAVLPLSSKSHWDAPVRLPNGRLLRILAAHPTPPVFDGPEDRNGRRNAAEILFWRAYVEGAGWIVDDQGRIGGLGGEAAFVLLGDLNADPSDGDGRRDAIGALLAHPRVQDPRPRSAGGAEAAALQGGRNAAQVGDPALDTADWRDDGPRGPGNLRVDYALPSAGLRVLGAGVFWPARADPLRRLVGEGRPEVSSDHRLVWVDVAPPR